MNESKGTQSLKCITVHLLPISFLKGLVRVANLSDLTFLFGNTVNVFQALISHTSILMRISASKANCLSLYSQAASARQ